MNRFELDKGCHLSTNEDGSGVLLGGSPLSMFRLTPAGVRIVRRIEAGEELGTGHAALTTRLAAAGAVHPVFDPTLGPKPEEVTLVIPAYQADPDRIEAIIRASGCSHAIVVDDASPTPLREIDGVTIVRLPTNVGPGAARQAGLDRVTTDLVAFVDTDISLPPSSQGWVAALLPCFADETVALAAPRIRAAAPAGTAPWVVRQLARFEATRGPLDLGERRGRVRAATRVSYVPSAALLCRVSALRSVGGFDPAMRLGEDVDLVWRLDEDGWVCRYEPGVEVLHDVRSTMWAWLRQRAGYGFSATDLALRHPGAVAPAQVSVWSAASWGLVAAGWPFAGFVTASGSTVALARKLPDSIGRASIALRLAGLGHLHAGRTLANAVARSWWPVSLLPALLSRRARRAVVAAAVVPALIEWWRVRHRIDPVRYIVLRALDDGAYGFGLWQGALRRRSGAALAAKFTGWPRWLRRADRSRPVDSTTGG